jgi:hypothetical protein
MTEKLVQIDGPMDQWFNVGEDVRILKTTDGFYVHMKREGRGWVARVTDLERDKFSVSREVYPSEGDLKVKCWEVIAEMREVRQSKFAL